MLRYPAIFALQNNDYKIMLMRYFASIEIHVKSVGFIAVKSARFSVFYFVAFLSTAPNVYIGAGAAERSVNDGSDSHCITQIEKAFRAERVLIERDEVSVKALQRVLNGYLDGVYCSVDELKRVNIAPFVVEADYGGNNKTSYILNIGYKLSCVFGMAVDVPYGRLRNIAVYCGGYP